MCHYIHIHVTKYYVKRDVKLEMNYSFCVVEFGATILNAAIKQAEMDRMIVAL